MSRYPCKYTNDSNRTQIVTIDTVLEKIIPPQTTVQFEASLNQLLEVKSLDGDITNIISDTIPCSKLIIDYYMAE